MSPQLSDDLRLPGCRGVSCDRELLGGSRLEDGIISIKIRTNVDYTFFFTDIVENVSQYIPLFFLLLSSSRRCSWRRFSVDGVSVDVTDVSEHSLICRPILITSHSSSQCLLQAMSMEGANMMIMMVDKRFPT